ncbi:TPA: tail fiber domain-containing protein [Aeromonas hydrophila]
MGYEVKITEYSNLTDLQTTNVDITEIAGIGTNTTEVIIVEGTNIGFVQVDAATAEAKAAAAAAKVSEQNAAAILASSVKKVGDTMTGTLNMQAPAGKQISFDSGNSYISNTYGNLYIRSNANEQSKVIIQGNAHPDVTVGTTTGKFYTELNKPTPAEIGTLTTAQINASLNLKSDLSYVNTELGKKADSSNVNEELAKKSDLTYVNTELGKKLNLSGGTMTGAITWDIDTKKYINGSGNNMYVAAKLGRVYLEGASTPIVRIDSNDYSIYHAGNKPTAADVGTMTTAQINTELGKKLNLSGGTLTGALIVANMKGAIKVDSQKSISFQDQSGTMYHLLAEGNNFKIKHGNNAENAIFDASSSQVATATSFYARQGIITQDHGGTQWLGMECDASRPPYISVRTTGDASPRQAITFNRGEITVNNDVLAATAVRVANNGGLVFSPTSERAGLTWGVGMEQATGDLCFHRYQNGVWQELPLTLKASGLLLAGKGIQTNTFVCTSNANIDGSLGVKQSIDVRGGYMSLTSASNTLLEFHTPGRTAAMIYKGPEGNMRFVSSNGSGGESLLRMQLDTSGNMSVNGAVWATSFNPGSDRRIKSNIVVLENCLEKNAKIIPCSYNKRGLPDDKREVGVIAQDVMEVLPDAVSEGPDGFYGVNYASVTSLNTGAINELHELVKQLQEEIRILKSK